jgi:hypothetical protein
MTRTKLVAVSLGAVVIAGGGTAALVGPAFGAASSTTSSSTTTTTTAPAAKPSPSPTSTSGSCNQPYPPAAPLVQLAASPATLPKGGGSTTLTANLSYNGCALNKETVSIYLSPNKFVASGQTNSKGDFSTTATVTKTSSFYASYAGSNDGSYLGAQSSPTTVTVANK